MIVKTDGSIETLVKTGSTRHNTLWAVYDDATYCVLLGNKRVERLSVITVLC